METPDASKISEMCRICWIEAGHCFYSIKKKNMETRLPNNFLDASSPGSDDFVVLNKWEMVLLFANVFCDIFFCIR